MSSPAVSIVIPAYRAEPTLDRVLESVRPQLTPDVEVIVVDSSGLESARLIQAQHPWLTVIGLSDRTLPGRARNLGVQAARGSQIVFLDADAVPAPDWLQVLRGAAADGVAAVAGAVANGTPGDPIGTASYLLEFSEFIPGRLGRPNHGASCNLLVERHHFETVGGFREDLWPGEDTVLTGPWATHSRLGFADRAIVSHLNRTGFREFIRHQFRLGRSFAGVCDHVAFPYAPISRWPFLPLAPILRLNALGCRIRGKLGRDERRLPLLALVLVGLVAWTAGLAQERSKPLRRGRRKRA